MYMDELEKIENDLKEAKVTFLAYINLSNNRKIMLKSKKKTKS